jgi:type IV secretion system protein VirD4
MTAIREQVSRSGKRTALWKNQESRSVAVASRPLLTPGEVMTLGEEEAVVLVAGLPPIRATKRRYYVEPAFQARVLPPPPLQPVDVPYSLPSPWLKEGPKPVMETQP